MSQGPGIRWWPFLSLALWAAIILAGCEIMKRMQ